MRKDTLSISVSEKDHGRGNPRAPVTLVEYADYECPYCASAQRVIENIRETLGDKLRFVFRNFPLTDAHPYAELAAEAAEAAGAQGEFWEMHDALFENQDFLNAEMIDEQAEHQRRAL